MADDRDAAASDDASATGAPGGPVDPRVGPQPVDEVDRPAVFTLMAPGWRPPLRLVTQTYGICFTPGGQVVLVVLGDGFVNLPGGQVELGEDPAETLVREVLRRRVPG
ncbi:NUDIX hydrolase [Streptomyces sp. ActVer]|uniref:NUDIX hydrolase n=1 Tax=Streptomyces sp. ActVer TaxID=3014558 RepID=UPI0022B4879B|nr:NUDIX hydrolase [Streptomyces sp. ActVer]MCZ4507408.1 NUDIX hydrolase [Streptomyces sp. ActVer]